METLPIINLTYEMYKVIVDLNASLNKRWRYSLGVTLEQSIMKLLEELIMAKYAPKPLKASYLIKASAQLDITRLKVRLLLDLKLVNETKISVSRGGTEDQNYQIETLTLLNDEALGWCCRAALAAAYVAHAHDAGLEKSRATLEGGVWAQGDLPTWRSMGS